LPHFKLCTTLRTDPTYQKQGGFMMRGKWILSRIFHVRTLSALAATGLVLAIIVWRTSGQAPDQQPVNPFASAAEKTVKTDGSLPIRQVVLFNSGVGYFQREGQVEGEARVELSFPTSDINDLLKSLILQDLSGGKISSVNYDSHDPIDKILHSFALDLNNNPTLAQILNQARGEKIELVRDVHREIHETGTIVGMEMKKQRTGKDGAAVDVELLNLSTDKGLKSIALEQVITIRFLNPVLESEFQRALRVLAASHDAQKKSVSLGFSGEGKRNVRVGYVVEHPIWKTSYRLRIDQGGKVFIQGWAIVENTSDEDWNDVRMVLVSGRPISYKMNMYEPLYIPRPEVEPELFASLRPPVHGGALNSLAQSGAGGMAPIGYGQSMNPGSMPPSGRIQYAPVTVTPNNQWISPNQTVPPANAGVNGITNLGVGRTPQAEQMMEGNGNTTNGMASQFESSIGKAFMATEQNPFAQQPGNKLTYDELQRRRQAAEQLRGKVTKDGAAIAGLNFKEGIASVASAEELGDYYQYVIDQKITLPRQKSALLPILDQTIAGAKVSIYNEATHAKFPLLGLKLKNSSSQPLSQGPITVYEEGSYAGDTRILDLQPGEERFLSYALDQAVEVKSTVSSSPSPDMTLKIGEANLTADYKLRQKRTYTIKNRAAKDRTVILEHPIQGQQTAMAMSSPYVYGPPTISYYPAAATSRSSNYQLSTLTPSAANCSQEWKLVEPKKPMETTRDLYRFQVNVPAGKTITFDVVEEQARVDHFALHGGQPQYVGDSGIQIKAQVSATPAKLLNLRIDKGLVFPTLKTRVSKTYFVQNNSDVDRKFTVDHIVSAGWARMNTEDEAEPQKGPAVHRFVLPVPKGNTAQREIVEERVVEEKGTCIRDLSDEALREYLANPAVSAAVKARLGKLVDMNAKMADLQKRLAAEERQLSQLSDDQARLRENLKIIPQTSEPYKKFLEKFVAQEGEIEGYQKQIRQLQTSVQQQSHEIEVSFGPAPQTAPPSMYPTTPSPMMPR
jgi:hypothetical protein